MLETVLERTKGKERTAFDGFFPTRRRYLCVWKLTKENSELMRRGAARWREGVCGGGMVLLLCECSSKAGVLGITAVLIKCRACSV